MAAPSRHAGNASRAGRLIVVVDGEAVKRQDLSAARKALTKTERQSLGWIEDYLVVNRAQILTTKAHLEGSVIKASVESAGKTIKERDIFQTPT